MSVHGALPILVLPENFHVILINSQNSSSSLFGLMPERDQCCSTD